MSGRWIRWIVSALLLVGVRASADQVFTNVTSAVGIVEAGATFGQAVAWSDYDVDGDLDLAFSYLHGSVLRLYRNDGGTFANVTGGAGLSGIGAPIIVWAEVTGDAYPELIVGNDLYGNDGDGTFTLISEAGLVGSVAATADLDLDGNLDLLSLNGALRVLWGDATGQFSAATVGGSNSSTVVCLDYDLDGRPDIYLGASSGANHLFHNEGGRVFTDVTGAAGVSCTRSTSGVTAGDYDNDGWPDLYVGNHLGQLSSPDDRLYRNNGDGTFADLTSALGAAPRPSTRTASFVDFDSDGWLDLLVNDHYYGNKVYRNNRDGSFTDVAGALNLVGGFGDYFGMGWGDYDADGAIDLFVAGHFHIYRLHRNDNCPGNWLTVRLIGSGGNRDAVGAKVEVFRSGVTVTRWVTAGEGESDFHSLELEFGLDDDAGVDSLRVEWPGGDVLRMGPIAANQIVVVGQDDDPTVVGEFSTGTTSPLDLAVRPNPSSSQTTLSFSLQRGASVSIQVFDVSGKRIRTLLAERNLAAGRHESTWTGHDEGGRPVPTGVYFARVAADGREEGARILFVR